MKAEELFKVSKSNIKKTEPWPSAFENRAYNVLLRAQGGPEDKEGDLVNHRGNINMAALERIIKNGSAWTIRGAGEKTIMLWCQWVTGERSTPETIRDEVTAKIRASSRGLRGE